MKKKGKSFIIPLVIYPFNILVSINETDDEIRNHFKKYNIEEGNFFEYQKITTARTLQLETGQTIIRFYTWESCTMATVAHEIFHAVTLILDRIGLIFDIDKNDEAYAYLIGYVTQEFYNVWNKK